MTGILHRAFFLTVLLGSGLLVNASAEPPAAEDEPATQPEVEPNSPRETALAMNRAMRALDEKAMIDLMHAATPEQKAYARAVAQSDAYVARLLAAVAERFGPAAVPTVQEAIQDISDDDIRAAEEIRDGSRARLVGKDGRFVFHYLLKDGSWKIDLAAAFEGMQVPISLVTADTYRRGNWAKVVAQDVAAGRYRSLEQLLDDIHERFGPPSTRPSDD
ncbi:MAG: hypothetical protein NZ561_11700 [Phycisphaerae bacterium]|nr:hypothetical protein [Phycisphaerae bacterium]